jgi:glutathione S-transferase
MKLYFNPQSRAVIAKWMLDECGAAYDTVPIDFKKREHKTPAFLAINPAGKLPALVDGDARLFENAAIGLYLAEKFPEAGLAPLPGSPERGRFLSLMVYSTSQLEPSMGDNLLKVDTQPSRGWNDFETVKDAMEMELGEGPWQAAHHPFSGADHPTRAVHAGGLFGARLDDAVAADQLAAVHARGTDLQEELGGRRLRGGFLAQLEGVAVLLGFEDVGFHRAGSLTN